MVRGFPPLLAGLSFSEDDTSALTPDGYGCPFGKLIKLMINPVLSTDYWERGLTYRAYSLNPHSAYREARNPLQILGRHPFSGSVCLSEPLGKLNNITTGLSACAGRVRGRRASNTPPPSRRPVLIFGAHVDVPIPDGTGATTIRLQRRPATW